ncbi:MAG: hypothetical protein ACHP8B_10880 [Terriglobales bacterium]
MFDKIKSMLGIRPQPAPIVVTVGGGDGSNYGDVPYGFFRVLLQDGKESLGYNDPPREYTGPSVADPEKMVTRMVPTPFGIAFNVGETVVVGGRRITLDVPRDTLPVVRLEYAAPTPGAARLPNGDHIIDTDAMGDSGDADWDGDPASAARASDINKGMW